MLAQSPQQSANIYRKPQEMIVFWLLKPTQDGAEPCGRNVSYISSDDEAIAQMEALNNQGYLVDSCCPVWFGSESEERLRETVAETDPRLLLAHLDYLMAEEMQYGKDPLRHRSLKVIGQEIAWRSPEDIERAIS